MRALSRLWKLRTTPSHGAGGWRWLLALLVLASGVGVQGPAFADCYSLCHSQCTFTTDMLITGPDGQCMSNCARSCDVQQENANRVWWGSIALSADGKFAKSDERRTRRAAEEAAMQKCRSLSAQPNSCKVASSFGNACGAVAVGGKSWSAPRSETRDMAAAEALALEECHRIPGNGQCKIIISGCGKDPPTAEQTAAGVAVTGALIVGVWEYIMGGTTGRGTRETPFSEHIKANSGIALSAESVGPFWDPKKLIARSGVNREVLQMQEQIRSLDRAGARYLSCTYGRPGLGFGPYYLWHGKVLASAADIAQLSRTHPLLGLGDRAFQHCPATLGEAWSYISRSMAEIEALDSRRRADNAGQLHSKRFTRPTPGQLGLGLYRLVEQQLQQGVNLQLISCTYWPVAGAKGFPTFSVWYKRAPADREAWRARDKDRALERVGGFATANDCPPDVRRGEIMWRRGRDAYSGTVTPYLYGGGSE